MAKFRQQHQRSASSRAKSNAREDHSFSQQGPEEEIPHTYRRWRQWYAPIMDVEANPPGVEKVTSWRHRWGRVLYLTILACVLLLGLNFLASHVFWYSAQGEVGNPYALSPTDVSVVKHITVSPGQRVHKGQRLMSFGSPELQKALTQAQANIASVASRLHQQTNQSHSTAESLRAEIVGLVDQYQALRQEYNQQQNMVDSMKSLAAKGALNFGDVNQLKHQQTQTKTQYAAVYAKLQADRAELRQLRAGAGNGKQAALRQHLASLSKLRESLRSQQQSLSLRAPVNGVVSQVSVTEGQTVKPGESAVVVVPRHDYRTLLYFPPAARPRLSTGQNLTVSTPDDMHIPMRITRIYPSIQDLPNDLQNHVIHQGRVIVAVAQPTRPNDMQKVSSGTPVTSGVPRWPALQWTIDWWSKVRKALS